VCGRFSLQVPQDDLVEVFDVPPLAVALESRPNVCPGQDVLVVGEDRRGRRMGLMRWGFVAPGGRPYINARGETVHRTPSFRAAFHRRRCLVPADGFYEWQAGPRGKVPFVFRPSGGGVLALAAIWEEGALAILTVEANQDVAPVHHRMPVLVEAGGYTAWLTGDATSQEVLGLIRPAPEGALVAQPASLGG